VAFEIRLKAPARGPEVERALRAAVEASRFTVGRIAWDGDRTVLVGGKNDLGVRLRTPRPYCGNHPAACEEQAPRVPAGRRNLTFLEGADWIAFNALVNDVLDQMEVNATVRNGGGITIRKDTRRRVRYGHTTVRGWGRTFHNWEPTGSPEDYQDYCGREAPVARFDPGTPGCPCYRPEE
jgi:hypothetical protein